jgi:hypothetical protein
MCTPPASGLIMDYSTAGDFPSDYLTLGFSTPTPAHSPQTLGDCHLMAHELLTSPTLKRLRVQIWESSVETASIQRWTNAPMA